MHDYVEFAFSNRCSKFFHKMYKESYLSANEHTTAKKSIQECKNAVKQVHKHRIFICGYFPLHRDNPEIIKEKTLIDLNQISQINEIIMEKPKRKHNENKVTTRGYFSYGRITRFILHFLGWWKLEAPQGERL